MAEPLFGNNLCVQIGILCKDLETTAKKYAEFFGVDMPPIGQTGPYEQAHTEYHGKPVKGRCRQAFFKVGPNIDIELIEPDGEDSVWRDDLLEHGEGLHHIAFNVRDMDACLAKSEAAGYPLRQRGRWDTGHYAYVDTRDGLKLVVELLENGKFDI